MKIQEQQFRCDHISWALDSEPKANSSTFVKTSEIHEKTAEQLIACPSAILFGRIYDNRLTTINKIAGTTEISLRDNCMRVMSERDEDDMGEGNGKEWNGRIASYRGEKLAKNPVKSCKNGVATTREASTKDRGGESERAINIAQHGSFYCVESAKCSSLPAHFSPLPFRLYLRFPSCSSLRWEWFWTDFDVVIPLYFV